MSLYLYCSVLLTFIVAGTANVAGPRTAVAVLSPRPSQAAYTIVGSVVFTETDNGLRLTGRVTGLPPGKYGFHVHESGDITTCDASAGHFNPNGTNHGGREHVVRHIGDLGNLEFYADGNGSAATIDITDRVLTLRGRSSVLGRTLVLHEHEDDLGLGANEWSLINGNAGPRVACGVIGIMSPIAPWNSAVTISPSLLLFIAAGMLTYLRV